MGRKSNQIYSVLGTSSARPATDARTYYVPCCPCKLTIAFSRETNRSLISTTTNAGKEQDIQTPRDQRQESLNSRPSDPTRPFRGRSPRPKTPWAIGPPCPIMMIIDPSWKSLEWRILRVLVVEFLRRSCPECGETEVWGRAIEGVLRMDASSEPCSPHGKRRGFLFGEVGSLPFFRRIA